jgi:hypothetical protein
MFEGTPLNERASLWKHDRNIGRKNVVRLELQYADLHQLLPHLLHQRTPLEGLVVVPEVHISHPPVFVSPVTQAPMAADEDDAQGQAQPVLDIADALHE